MVEPWLPQFTYEQWIEKDRAVGGLLGFLDGFFRDRPGLTVLELGSGNSTRVLAHCCKQVISIDIDPTAAVIPVLEKVARLQQDSKQKINSLTLETNVRFICADILTMNFDILKEYVIDVIFFDLGLVNEDKWLYRAAYDRLKADMIINSSQILLLDNANVVPDFKKYLVDEGGVIENSPGGGVQCIVRFEEERETT